MKRSQPELGDDVETRECPSCRNQVIVPSETEIVWCPCDGDPTPMDPIKAGETP